jgi:hypothetical protein
MPQTKLTQTEKTLPTHGISFVAWNEINEPGIYVDMEYPRFYRVTQESLIPGSSPSIHGSEFTVARVSTDPMLNKQRIQIICADNNLPVPE